MATQKIKATIVTMGGMVGIDLKQVTFHDYENLIFSYGRERTKRQFKNLDDKAIFKGHLDVETLENKKYDTSEPFTKKRHFPPCKEDLERDLAIWKEIKDKEKLHDFDLEPLILNEIEKAR